jgi:hypothetical protein
MIRMRRNTPLDFYAEMEITFQDKYNPQKNSRTGFLIDGKYFLVMPTGKIFKFGYNSIPDFAIGKPVRMLLIRNCSKKSAEYIFRVNGMEVSRLKTALPNDSQHILAMPGAEIEQEKQLEKSNPLVIFAYNANVAIDNFKLYSVKAGTDDSPNTVINSSFEYSIDGFPPYYGRNWWAFNFAQPKPYENYLAAWSLDQSEKHSGKQSLKIVSDETTVGYPVLWAWRVPTIRNMPGVFSLWLKSDQDNFPVVISCGVNKKVKVGKEWKRYEVVNPKLPAPGGVYSPVTVRFDGKHGTLWLDDLQFEILGELDEAKHKLGETFATPYKPSPVDKHKFGKRKKVVTVRAPTISIAKLPKGLVPGNNLDAWKNQATKLEKFYHKRETPKSKTELYLACDDANLYVGYRCLQEQLPSNPKPCQRDSHYIYDRDSVEFFLDPTATGKYFQLCSDYSGSQFEKSNGDLAWNGNWKSDVTINKENSCVDYVLTLPLYNFASPDMKSQWLVNFCRNDRSNNEFPAIAYTPTVTYTATGYWPYARVPEEVAKNFMLGVMNGSFSDTTEGIAILLPVQNYTDKERMVAIELYDVANNGTLIDKKSVKLKKGENKLTFASKRKTRKVRLKITENTVPICEQMVSLKKHSLVSILNRLDYYMNEPEAIFKIKTNLAAPQELTAVLECANNRIEAPASSDFKVTLPLKNIPDGTHNVTLTLLKDGETVGSVKAKLVKRPYKKGATQINHFTRSVIHDGKPILPVMPFTEVLQNYTKQKAENVAKFLDENGFRYALFMAQPKMEKQVTWFMDEANKRGIKIMFWGDYKVLKEKAITPFVKKFAYPNIFSQMVEDEAELRMPSDKARDFLRKLRPYFPYHPVHMNYTVLGFPARFGNLESDIFMLDDYLTNQENRTVASVVKHADIMQELGEEEGKPCYYFIVGGNMPLHYREPSYNEQIAQSYGCIAAGCTGLGYFYGYPGTPGNWKGLLQVNKELQTLSNVILSEEVVPSAHVSGNPKRLRYLTKKHNGYLYIVSCNIDKNPAKEVIFTLPAEYDYDSSAEVMFEKREVSLSGKRFTDNFAGHTRHVYKVKIRKE